MLYRPRFDSSVYVRVCLYAPVSAAVVDNNSTTLHLVQQKRREKFPYSWKERYFILERQSSGKHTLQYFEDKESSKDEVKELGVVDLSSVTNVRF